MIYWVLPSFYVTVSYLLPRFQVSSDETSQLWLSIDEKWQNARLLCNLSRTSPSQIFLTLTRSCTSSQIPLVQGGRYYIEVAQIGNESSLQVSWKMPGFSMFVIIEEEFTSIFQHENANKVLHHNIESIRDTFNFGPLCSTNSLSVASYARVTREVTYQYVPHTMVKDALPYCLYNPSYVKTRTYFLNRHQWTFLWKPVRRDTYVYPYLEYRDVYYSESFPATPLQRHKAVTILSSFMTKLQTTYPGWVLSRKRSK